MQSSIGQHALSRTASEAQFQLRDVPAPIFNLIHDLLNHCFDLNVDMDGLFSWIENVDYHRNFAPESGTREKRRCRKKESATNADLISRGPETNKTRYICYKCNESLGTRKEFRRHMKEKCELLSLWWCPDCHETYTRKDHLTAHHKNRHPCFQAQCNHLIDSEKYVTPKQVLGCGYCIRYFSKASDFINHLAKHFHEADVNPVWSDTTSIHSMLQHPRIQPAWKKLCTTRFNSSTLAWPTMTWNLRDVKQEVHELQYDVTGQGLDLCLAKLIEKGRFNQRLYSSPTALASSINLSAVDGSYDTMSQLTVGGVQTHFDDCIDTSLTNDITHNPGGIDDFINTSPSTLVDAGELWAVEPPTPARQNDWQDEFGMILDTKRSLNSTSVLYDDDSDFMRSESLDNVSVSTLCDAGMFNFDFDFINSCNIMTENDANNNEDIIMDWNKDYQTANAGIPMSTTPSTFYCSGSSNSSFRQATPCSNPITLPSGGTSHRRSLSDRFRSMMKSYTLTSPNW